MSCFAFGGRRKSVLLWSALVAGARKGVWPPNGARIRLCSTVTDEVHDVVIAGGGMVGNAMAASLGRLPELKEKKILVLEMGEGTEEWTRTPDRFSNRVSSISPASRQLFQELGVWDWMVENGAKKVNQLQVWDGCSESRIHYEQPDFRSEICHVVENILITSAFARHLKEHCPQIKIQTRAKVKGYRFPKSLLSLAELDLEDGRTIRSRLIIGADGAGSLVRKAMDVHFVSWDYHQKGVVATMKLAQSCPNDVSWQRFTPTGPIALLPLSDEVTSLVWSTTDRHSTHLLSLSDEDFLQALNDALYDDSNQVPAVNNFLSSLSSIAQFIVPGWSRTGAQFPPEMGSVEPGSRAAFPLGLGHASNYISPRAVLIGDAAHRIHPLAGQGLNLGLGDVACLSRVLQEAFKNGADLGSEMYLRDFECERQKRVAPTMVTCDWLNRLYSTSFGPAVLLRSLGLNSVNRLDFLKQYIVKETSRF